MFLDKTGIIASYTLLRDKGHKKQGYPLVTFALYTLGENNYNLL